jgi:hypothetical protein
MIVPSEAWVLALARRVRLVPELQDGDMLELLGHLASMIDNIPLARLRMQGLKLCLLRQWRLQCDSLTASISVDVDHINY